MGRVRPPASPDARRARARYAALTATRLPGDPDLVQARRELEAAMLGQRIDDALNAEYAPTLDQRRVLAARLTGGVQR